MSASESISPAFSYVGQELDHFRMARNWKAYWYSQIAPYLGQDVLEVGAGNGNNSVALLQKPEIRLTALEPDAALVSQHRGILNSMPADQASRVELVTGTMADIPADRQYDSILYIDVLEHIEGDAEEALAALPHLKPGGHLVVLSPAFMVLYSPFDKALGHYRRYTLSSLARVIPPALRQRKLIYMDCLAFALSLGNRLVLGRSVPHASQIRFWDGLIVPLSRVVDPLLRGLLGRSVLGIWQKDR
jgi:ubiquinone/menaquinone biosynthesis C-methylase UbiE